MKNIEINNISGLKKVQEAFNSVINDRIEECKIKEYISGIDDMNIGDVNMIFESISDKIFDNHQELYAKYVKTLKENKDLRSEYLLYKKLNESDNVSDPTLFLNQVLLVSENWDKKSLHEGEKKLKSIVKECIRKSGVDSYFIEEQMQKKTLNESITYLINNKRKMSNLNECCLRMSNIIDHLTENKKNEVEALESAENIDATELLQKLNKILNNGDISDIEKSAIQEMIYHQLANGSDEELFENYKKECLDIIQEQIQKCDGVEEKSTMESLHRRLNEKVYNKDTYNDDMFHLATLKNTLLDEE